MSTPIAGSLAVTPLYTTAGDVLVEWDDAGQTWRSVVPAGAGAGTVTSIAAGAGLTGSPNPIVGTGTLALTVPVVVANGGTGATTAGAALANLGGAPLASPVFTGDPRAPTPATADNDTSIATTAYVKAQGYGAGTVTSIAGGTGITVSPSPIVGTGSVALTVPVSIANGGTNAITAPAALTALGAFPLAGGTITGATTFNGTVTFNGTTSPAYLQLTGGTITGPLTGTSLTLSTPLGLASGGTGAATAAAARTALGAVNKAGDTMTGNLTIINPTGYSTVAVDSIAGTAASVLGYKAGSLRWEMDLGSAAAESGGNVGSDFIIARFSDTAAYLGNSFTINRATGNATFSGALTSAGIITATNVVQATGYQARPGTAGPARGNYFNIDWAPGVQLWIDGTNQGTIAFTCDYRIKENVADLPSTWDRVKGLRPISYSYKACPELLREVGDPAERWGFLAHELQETLLPTAASGTKDAPNLVQSPDLLALLASVTKALQEAMARIEALESPVVPWPAAQP